MTEEMIKILEEIRELTREINHAVKLGDNGAIIMNSNKIRDKIDEIIKKN